MPDGTEELGTLPVDSDLDAFGTRDRRGRWPRLRAGVVVAVGVGSFAGGLVRYEATVTWPQGSGFPWAIFGVNTAGAFILGLLLVLVLEVLPPTTYLRPLLGTGFCGGLTTFSAVAAGSDSLVAHGRAGLAAGYLASSVAAGLGGVALGVILARSLAAYRNKE